MANVANVFVCGNYSMNTAGAGDPPHERHAWQNPLGKLVVQRKGCTPSVANVLLMCTP